MIASSENQILTETKLAESYLENTRTKGGFPGVRRWRVIEVKQFPDGGMSSVEQALALSSTGLSVLNICGTKIYVARIGIVARGC